ncbi:MAG: chalcone isomerase family protein [Desulfobacterales bacterium]
MQSLKTTAVGFLSLIAVMQPLAAGAADMDDINFEKQYKSPEIGLALRGVGLLKYLGLIKAYAGAFYLEEGVSIDEALADRAKRIEVEYLRSFKGQDFGPATVKMMEKNVDRATIDSLRKQIDYHNSLYQDVGPGDRYSLTYIPGKGTELALNGEPKGTIEGAAFATALFSIWIGQKPIDESFKRQILGL